MSAPIADGVMAATHKLVQQAMTGQWREVPKTVEERRALLEQLTSNARPQDHQWLGALRQAVAESDAAVAKMAATDAAAARTPAPASTPAETTFADADAVSAVMAMLPKGG